LVRLLMGSVPLHAIVFVFFGKFLLVPILILHFLIYVRTFVMKVSGSAVITSSSAKRTVLVSLFIFVCIPFMLSVFRSDNISFMIIFCL
jgi:hypothetical protein